jgi:hypothetical protein
MSEIILATVESTFEMLVRRPRKTVGGGSGMVRSMSEVCIG